MQSKHNHIVERGSVSFIQGDFFHSDCTKGEKFDVIYDYTVSHWELACVQTSTGPMTYSVVINYVELLPLGAV
jgi:hypothetical protein